MYTVEFTQEGWAVFKNVDGNIFILTTPLAGDNGKAISRKLAADLNAKSKG